jgi:predicted nucleotidyltransferase
MENIFSTRQRIKILQAIIFKTGSISVNNIANQLGLSKGLISKYFDILVKKGVLKRVNGKFSVTNSSLVKGLKILVNIKNIDLRMFKKYTFIAAVGLYGSCAKGENTEDSDVDLWVKLKNVSEEELAPLTSEVNKKTQNIKLLFLTDKKIEKVKREDSLFYHSLVFGSIILYGCKDGIQV